MAVPKPKVMIHDARRQVIDTFGGINKALRIREGEWNEALNLTAEHYPLLAVRKPRRAQDMGIEYGYVIDMIEKSDHLWVLHEKNGVYMLDDIVIGNYGEIREPKQLVGMGAYIIVLGANYWYNTADDTSGTIDAEFRVPDTALDDYSGYKTHVLTLCPCDADGNELRIRKVVNSKKAAEWIENPGSEFSDGDCLADGENKVIRKWHGPSSTVNPSTWEIMPNLLLLRADGIAEAGFKEGDSVEISGILFKSEAGVYAENWDPNGVDPGSSLTTYNSRVSQYDDDPNGTHKVQKLTNDAIVLKDLFFTRRLTASYTAAGEATIGRKMPDMDFVVEAQNRLWGCKYGKVNGEMVNEIYASELGNFYNWRNYDGTSMASYAASVGTDGAWTGAISYGGYPLFFKEKCMHKVFPSAYGAHQIKDYTMDGVKGGCFKGLCIVDNVLYYVGQFGIYAYTGGTPVCISDALGFDTLRYLYTITAGGANGNVYFGGFCANAIEPSRTLILHYDARHGIWHEESVPVDPDDGSQQMVEAITTFDDNVFAAIGTTIYGLFTHVHERDAEAVAWTCTSGLIGYEDVDQKYISRFVLRVKLAQGSKMDVQIEYDSDGKWVHAGTLKGTTGNVESVVFPVRPRRCDHFRLKLSGTGEMALYSFAKQYADGSDVR